MSVEKEDKILFCRDCGEEFIFSAREQEFYAQKGFENDPARCSACRSVRKRGGNETVGVNAPNFYNGGNSYGNGGNSYGNGGNSYGSQRPNNYGNGGNSYGSQRPNNYGNQGGNSYGNGSNYNHNNGGNSYGNQRPNNYGNQGGNSYGGNSYGNQRPNNYGNQGGNSYGNMGYNQMERPRYPIVCANCGIKTEVPFEPREGVPVFCRTCYNSQKPNRN